MTGLKFLLDVNIGSTLLHFLVRGGHDVKTVLEINPRMSDEIILHLAHREGRILITCDKDFGDLIYNRGFSHKGVIRLEDAKPPVQIRYLQSILKKHRSHLSTSMIVAQAGIVRIRK